LSFSKDFDKIVILVIYTSKCGKLGARRPNMDFEIGREQKAVLESAQRFLEKEVDPYLKEQKFKRELVRKMGQQGFFGSAFPIDHGGTDFGFLTHAMVCEEFSMYDSGLRSLFNLQGLTVPYTVMEWGTQRAREKYVSDLVTGERLGCICLSEPNAGSDLAAMERRIEDCGEYIRINGTKTWISNGTVADVGLVFGSSDRSLKHKGLCAVVVDTNQKGWQPKEIDKLGDKASPVAEVFMDDVIAPKDNLLGEWGGGGFQVAMCALDRGRISVSSGAVGIAQACINASVRYANQREQFGKKIGEFQMIKKYVADMVSFTEAARLLVWRAAWLNDMDRPFTREVALAKLVAGEVCVRAAGWAMEIHGGMGYSLELPVERYYRDSKLYQIGEGTANIMRLVIADDALGIKKANRPRVKTKINIRDFS
jgi:glutaryl-CoA dehydrogenase (non-decarboxylating)